MKRKIIGLMLLLSSISVASVGQAITIVLDHSSVNGNLCDAIGGNWKGTGTAKPLWTCNYTGTAHVDTIPGTNTFKIHIDLPKGSGLYCPEFQDDLNGTCNGNVIQIGDQSSEASFNGTLNEKTGKLAADLTGTVIIKNYKTPVNPMHLDKQPS